MDKVKLLIAWLLLSLLLSCTAGAKERILANYFDVPLNSTEGTEVTGRIHIARNKDVLTSPIPEGYQFEILEQADGLFRVETCYDQSRRIMGVLTVAPGKNTGATPACHSLVMALKDGDKLLNKFTIRVKVVEETLWNLLSKRYTPQALKISRLYGRIEPTDEEVAAKIDELRNNGWMFAGLEKCYQKRPQDYVAKFDPANDHAPTETIEYDWEKVVVQIGGLGYAYATSSVYGPKGNPEKRSELREAICQSLLMYINSFPLEGDEVLVDGKPIGHCIGDGFSMLQAHKMAGMQIPTHQWTLTDPLVVPLLHLMPDLLRGMKEGDRKSLMLHDAVVNYLQIFFTEIESRRRIDDPDGRWGVLQDTIYSSGAWADANLGHRLRTMLALPIIWADYNRPLTYVQYWYKDYYRNPPFEGFSFSPGWEPQGVVADISRWMTKYNVPAHEYIQSGFQPDGTVSHHVGNATDAAMVAYGFGWLTECNMGYDYLKDTDFKVADKYYQFQADRLFNVYPKLFYKQRMDFLVAGRSFLEDMKRFATRTYPDAVEDMLRARSKDTNIEGMNQLRDICQKLQKGTFEYSGTEAFWVNEYLVHRRGARETPFYASLKLKSERTVGAEDFSKKVRRSWHMGYGILQVKVRGDEYADRVLGNFDWHALPGLTEEWRTDPMPLGNSQGSLPGLNKISGVLSDGTAGMGIYHHLPKETYSSATALKSYHFIEDHVIAMGSNIGRLREGQGKEIATFIDQSALTGPLTWCIGGRVQRVEPGQSVNVSEELNSVCWLHHGSKGYILMPSKKLSLQIKSGKEVNVTDRKIADGSPNFIIALNHGVVPGQEWDNSYRYVQLPNVSAGEMPERVAALLRNWAFVQQGSVAHAVYSAPYKTWQYAFFKPGSIAAGDITVTSDDASQIMLRDTGTEWVLSVNNPMPDGRKQTLTFHISVELPAGTYTYYTRGIYPLKGETLMVATQDGGSKVTVELPDCRDAVQYNYQSDLYAATPIVVNIPKK